MPPLTHRSIHSSGRNVHGLVMELAENGIDLDPPYQRGDVWSTDQRVNLIKSILMGIPVAAIVLNRRGENYAWDRVSGPHDAAGDPYWACIDGKQRLTTVRLWMQGELAVPADWFDAAAQDTVTFDRLDIVRQRWWRTAPLSPSPRPPCPASPRRPRSTT